MVVCACPDSPIPATSPDDQDDPPEDDPPEDDPDKALLEQTLAHALTPQLRPAPPPRGERARSQLPRFLGT